MPLSVLVSPRTSTGAAIIQPCVTRSGFSCSLALAACGDPTSATDSASNSSITVRADGLLPVITPTVAGQLESRADGSARVLRPAPIDFLATARAIASATRPQFLTAKGRIIVTCTASAIPGVSLQILDSLTNVALLGSGTMRIRLTDGVQTDSLTATLISGWGGAVERAGTFSLTIDADGFLPWRQDGIVVTKGLCHVRQMRVIARLVRR